jgi:ribosomal protein L32
METKDEGPALPQMPFIRHSARDAAGRKARFLREAGDPRCEMCGSPVIAHHCKRICLKCGFMTGCSEGI